MAPKKAAPPPTGMKSISSFFSKAAPAAEPNFFSAPVGSTARSKERGAGIEDPVSSPASKRAALAAVTPPKADEDVEVSEERSSGAKTTSKITANKPMSSPARSAEKPDRAERTPALDLPKRKMELDSDGEGAADADESPGSLPSGARRPRRAAVKRKSLAESDSDESGEEGEEAAEAASTTKSQARKRVRVVADSSDEDFAMGEAEEEGDDDDEDEGEPSDDESPVKKGPAKAKAQAARRPADSGTADGASKASASKKPASAHAAGAARPLASPRPAGTSGAAGARAADLNTVSEMRKDKTARFEAKNQERYKWLLDVRDKDGKRPDETGYDPRTLLVPKSAYAGFTNFERQFWDIKKEHFDVVLFFKKGKFFEMFEGDADIGHRHLHLKLTDRTNMRMCGVPEGRFATYAGQLVAKGFKVGRVEQMETMNAMQKRTKVPAGKAPAKGAVCERELCQILTQGTLTDESMLEGHASNFLLALCAGQRTSTAFGVCLVEASTGVFYVGELDDDMMLTELETLLLKAKPREVVFPKGGLDPGVLKLVRRHLDRPIINAVNPEEQFWDAATTLRELDYAGYFSAEAGDSAAGVGEGTAWPANLAALRAADARLALSALGGCVWYLRSLKLDSELVSMRNFRTLVDFDGACAARLVIDGQTLANLEVLENSSGGAQGSLLHMLDRCVTACGKRKLRAWLCAPLARARDIDARLDAVEAVAAAPARGAVVALLRRLPDVERSLSRVHTEASGRRQGVMFDNSSAKKLRAFLALLDACGTLCDVQERLDAEGLLAAGAAGTGEEGAGGGVLARLVRFPEGLRATLEAFKHSYGDLHQAMEDGFISPERGAHADYDVAADALREVEKALEAELARWARELKTGALKFWHPAAGKEPYQIEVPVALCGRLPHEFELKTQTGKVKRYWTAAISRLVLKLIDARETLDEIRQAMVRRMHCDFDRDYACWSAAAEAAAVLDCLAALSHTAVENGEGPVCRPVFLPEEEPESRLCLLESRHPCLAGGAALRGGAFIHNDIVLGFPHGGGEDGEPEPRACVVTGPNMGGKSTLLRQACVSVILAQVGAFVPARVCRLRAVDRIFTRIGASDRIMQGQSTFLVELAETATILRHATPRSLVVLDELGRGTSTHDGYAIARAVLQHLAAASRPLLLFSTHYHALTDEISALPSVSLFHMDCLVDDARRAVTFLYKFVAGVSQESYGLHCAQAAGLPVRVVERAAQHKEAMQLAGGGRALRQLALFKALAAHVAAAATEPSGAAQEELLRLQREVGALVAAMASG